MIPEVPASRPAPKGVTVGHVHLKVSDLDRAIAFYSGVLGFDLVQRYGPKAAFLSAGGYHHQIGLNTWESARGTPPPGHTGLYHVAFLYPTRADLGIAIRRVADAGIALDGAADHGVSEAVYLRDPDDNGIELYWDKPRDLWPMDTDGRLSMVNDRLDVAAIVAEGDRAAGGTAA